MAGQFTFYVHTLIAKEGKRKKTPRRAESWIHKETINSVHCGNYEIKVWEAFPEYADLGSLIFMLKAIILIQIFASLDKKSRLAGLSVLLTIQDPTLFSQPVFPEETKACHLKKQNKPEFAFRC